MPGNAALLLLLTLPLALAVARAPAMRLERYLFNTGGNSTLRMAASVVASNVGIGTFVALYAFSTQSPLVGAAIAGAYTLGLLACAACTGPIRALAARTGTHGLVDAIVAVHGVRNVWLVWLPISTVFFMRATIQLLALAMIIAGALGWSFSAAMLAAVIFAGACVVLGGYRVATETDAVQAAVIVTGVAIAAAGVLARGDVPHFAMDLGPFPPSLFLGILLLLPFSAVISIDNWQRITTARSTGAARKAFLMGGLVAGCVYALIVTVALARGAGDVTDVFRAAMPAGLAILADLVFVACIMSSVDTLILPMMTTFARRGMSLARIRLAVCALFCLLGIVCLLAGDLLQSVVAAFSTLVVFLPVVLGTFHGIAAPRAAIASLWTGLAVVVVMIGIDINLAGIVGFAVAALVYAAAASVALRGVHTFR